MTAQRYRVHLMDEAPRIGSGQRIVSVLVGRLWVRIATDDGRRGKLTKADWAQIARKATLLPPRRHRKRHKTAAQFLADQPLLAKKPQNFVMDGGLFGDSHLQKELF